MLYWRGFYKQINHHPQYPHLQMRDPRMALPQGMLTLDQLGEEARTGAIDTVLVVFTDLYGRFMGKRFDAEFFLDDIHCHGTHGCDYLLTVDMEMEPVPGYTYANWERGYGDF